MSDLDIDKYTELMMEVKRRTDVAQLFLREPQRALYKPTAVESACLQIRMILELVALGSLVANKDRWSKSLRALRSAWNAGDILKELGRINPDFYPRPVVEIPGEGIVKSEIKDRAGDFLTEDAFGEVYGRLGGILHASNPLASPVDYDEHMSMAHQWMDQIINLLNSHTVRVLDNPNMFLVHMQEERDDNVHVYTFSPYEMQPEGTRTKD
ncbi:MAG: hypothetical protein F4Z96_03780 [Chloroflexi bacterium]|nr:hypothetical protein [Chloroflexota bacterium]MYB40665.1 hypothetical protein [Chloroflexota bacterium]